MKYSVEKPGTPAELVHHGVKGQKWGVRKESSSTGDSSSKTSKENESFWTPERKSTAKKAVVGVGILTAVAGGAFVAYKLKQNGKLPISSLKKAAVSTPAVKKIIQEPTDIIHLSRGKHKGLSFLKQGGTPDHFSVWEKALGKYAHSSTNEIFEKSGDMIAARFLDPKGRKDFSGRVIPHEVLIPKSMSEGIHNIEDVKNKIWPHLSDAFDANYDLPMKGLDAPNK